MGERGNSEFSFMREVANLLTKASWGVECETQPKFEIKISHLVLLKQVEAEVLESLLHKPKRIQVLKSFGFIYPIERLCISPY